MAMASVELGRHLGFATSSTTMATGAKWPDWQTGAQTMMIALANTLSPADMLTGAGALHGDNVFSHASLLLDCEVFAMAARFGEGISVRDEDIAVDLIVDVGPGGHFLDREHTLTNMRTIWRDSLMDRRNWDAWEAEGRPDPSVGAEERAREIVASHAPLPLDRGVAAELDAIVAAYEADALAEA
jgi:trimethylamine--corrinoid protein Co-methyltransferase